MQGGGETCGPPWGLLLVFLIILLMSGLSGRRGVAAVWVLGVAFVCAIMVLQSAYPPGPTGSGFSNNTTTQSQQSHGARVGSSPSATSGKVPSGLVSWAETSLSMCKEDHPSIVFPLRVSELDENLACSQSVIGPMPNVHIPGGNNSSYSGSLPPQFGLYNMQLADDPADGYMVLLGATGSGPLNGTQTWTFRDGNWSHLSLNNSPESCMGSVMSYDSFDGYVLYFAGGNFGSGADCTSAGQTWSFHAGAWTQLHPSSSPPVRLSAGLTNDSADGYMVLFGGACNEGVHFTVCNDTWKFLAGTWTNITLPGAPAARAGAGMTYDAADGYVLMFGGTAWPVNMNAPLTVTDTWKFHNGTWTQILIGGILCGGPTQPGCGSNAPPGPFNDGLTYDASDGYALYTCAEENTSYKTQDGYWKYHAGVWTDLNNWSAGQINWVPTNRIAEGLSYDWGDGYAVLFGGIATNWDILNDTWTFHAGYWTNSTALTASADASPTSGSSPLTVSFTGSASGGTGPYAYSWSFGDGSAASATQNPTHAYTDQGDYTAVLTASDQRGHTATYDLLITVSAKPTLELLASASPVCGESPLNVSFSDAPSGGTAPYSYFWNFSDGSYAYTQNATHLFSSNGNYTVTTVVTDSLSSSVTRYLTIFVSSAGCTNPVISQFTATPSSVSLGNSSTLAVTAAGGSTPYTYAYYYLPPGCASANAAKLTCTPTATGIYWVEVNVTDSASHSFVATTELSVTSSVGPVITSIVAYPNPVEVNTSTTFNVTAEYGAVPYSYSYSGLPPGCATADTHELSCTPTATGAFAVTAVVTDANGSSTAGEVDLDVIFSEQAPSVSSFLISPTAGVVGQTFYFNATAAGGVQPYSWSMQGEPSGVGQSSSYGDHYTGSFTATSTGVYNITVTVTGANDKEGSAWSTITVTSGLQFSALIAFDTPSSGPAPLTVEMTGTAHGGVQPYTFLWTFGDGTSGTGSVAIHTYSQAPTGCPSGASCTYDVTLVVSDSENMSTATSVYVTITPQNTTGLHASVVFDSPSRGYAPLTVTVSGNASGGTAPYTYMWEFGDGNAASGPFVSHTYPGNCSASLDCDYVLALTVYDSTGASAYDATEVVVWSNATSTFSTAITVSPSTGPVGQMVHFGATASGGANPYSFYWYFGDGSLGTNASVAHTYSAAGTYTVVLLTTDATGVEAEASAVVVEYPAPPSNESGTLELSVSAGPATGLAPLTVAFNGSAKGGTAPYDYSWSFGDGGTAAGQTADHVYSTPGVYVSTLIVSDAAGDQASTGVFIAVNPSGDVNAENGLAVSVTADSMHGSVPFTTTFYPAVHGGFAPYSLVWAFGDGTSLTTYSLGPVTHTYSKPGSFYPVLTVTDAEGAQVNWSTGPSGIDHPVVVSTTSSGPLVPVWLIAVAIAVGAVLVITALVARRRKLSAIPEETQSGTASEIVATPRPPGPPPETPIPPKPPELTGKPAEPDILRDLY